MKITFDLPPDLVRDVKLQAVHEGRKLKDVAAELLKRGLTTDKQDSRTPNPTKGAIKLPLFSSPKTAPASRMSTAALLSLEQETLNQEDHQRLGLSV
jgi:hypothetical protein